jgi:glycosyltransferase involved in cell wall biosynthesis
MTVSPIRNLSALSVKDLPAPPAGKRGWPWTVGSKLLPSRRSDGSDWPRLSIVTPSYNQGQFLEATIRSVLLQGYPNLEYIVIDGGSGDESVEIIRKYEKFLSYWVSEKDKGQTDAINKGLKKSTGEILAWMNSDDIYAQGAFKKVAFNFSQDTEVVVVYSNRVLIDEEQRVFGCSPLKDFNPPKTAYSVCSETAFWRRKAMDNIGLLDTSLYFCMDLDFFSRLFTQGTFKRLDDYLGYFRCHSSSKTGTVGDTLGLQEITDVSIRLFGVALPGPKRPTKLKALKEFIKHPLLLGIPYVRTRFDRITKETFLVQ